VQDITDGVTVDLPVFDKSLCGGEGDRSAETVKITGPIDVFILEGWSMGFAPLSEAELKRRYDNKQSLSDTSYFLSHPLSSLLTLNNYLEEFSKHMYPPFSTFVQVEPESYQYVFSWRLEQERNMKAANGGKGMTDDQVKAFVERYMPGYELWKEGVWASHQPWAGRGLRLWYGKDREVVKVEVPEAASTVPEPSTQTVSANSTSVSASSAQNVDASPQQVSKPASAVEKSPVKASHETASATSTAPNDKFASTPAATQPSVTDTAHTAPFNPGWSRKFLAAKSPLIPSYDQIPSLSTLHQDSQVLRSSSHLAFFPVQGPGGRIGIHPLKKKGRMPVGGEGYVSGGVEVTDFAVEPFDRAEGIRVALAGVDGNVRIWAIGENGVQGPGPEPQQVLKGEYCNVSGVIDG
jgi:hypothetical protein